MFILTVLFSFNGFAAQTCDLNVTVSQIEGEKVKNVIAEVEMLVDVYSQADAQQFTKNKAKNQALEQCRSQGADQCKVTQTADDFGKGGRGHYMFLVRVEGIKTTGGKKISDAQYSKKRLEAICNKINSCINEALNDESSSMKYMEKLAFVKTQNNCNQVENIMFENN
jgi:hypothetical protein